MATSDPETMWINSQDQFSSVCWRNMKTCVIRYADSSHKTKEKKDGPSAPPGPPSPPGASSSPPSSSPSTSSSSSSPPKYEKEEYQLWSKQIDKDYGKVWYNEKTKKSQKARPDCLIKYKYRRKMP